MKTLSIALCLTLSFSTNLLAEDENHSHDFSKEISAFHDILSPLWHAEKGPERATKTCGTISQLTESASKIANGDLLTNSLSKLAEVCTNNISDFETAFHDAHEAFHLVVKASEK